MPMSLAASLGTTLTLISAPAFLLANDLLKRAGQPRPGHLHHHPHRHRPGPAGHRLHAAGALAGAQAQRRTRRRRTTSAGQLPHRTGGREGIALDRKDPRAICKRHSASACRWLDWLRRRAPATAAERQRAAGGRRAAGPGLPRRTRLGQGRPGPRPARGREVRRATVEDSRRTAGEEQLVQAVVAPHSEFVGRSVGRLDFPRNLGVVVVGLWRKARLAAWRDVGDAAAGRRPAGAVGPRTEFRRARHATTAS